MKRLIYLILIIAICLPFVACNDDDDDDGEDRNMGGSWSGAVTKDDNNCANDNSAQTVNFSHQVNQNGGNVTLTDQSNTQYSGEIVGADGFSVQRTAGGTGALSDCELTTTVEYDNIDSDDDTTANVDFTVDRECTTAANNCFTHWTGTASRIAGVSPTPQPGVTPTPGAVAGGCADINTRPAAGTYAGDGGCSISDVGYRIVSNAGQSTVVLEPFGANGATSFAINTTNSSTASSARSDLVVNGDSGYSCSLTCSPPATFTISCFQEGGTQCVEKF